MSIRLALASALVAMAQPALAEPQVATESGTVRGADKGSVSEFLGIPFAQPPVGEQRWKAPAPVKPWAGVRDATKPAPACYQDQPKLFGPYTPEFLIDGNVSEDCLYLNVWTPERRKGPLPVYFYIHGGGFGSGSGSIPVYNGSGLASKGAVVVTINYRLGAFGFLAHPDLTAEAGTSGNYAFMDMIAALKWVKANIAKFGGDPNNVTISGQSAGAAAVNSLLFAPDAKGLFHRAVAESGSGSGFPIASFRESEATGRQFLSRMGVTSIDELRKVPAADILAASSVPPPTAGSGPKVPAIRFSEVIDGVTLLATGGSAGESIQSNVPFLTGFVTDDGYLPGAEPQTPVAFELEFRRRFGVMAERFLALYPHSSNEEAVASFREMSRDKMLFDVLNWSEARSKTTGQPIYIYYYNHDYPSAGEANFGTFHTAEVPYIMGALGLGPRKFTRQDYDISAQLQSHWLAFMRSGDPSTPALAWAKSPPGAVTLMGLGDKTGMRSALSTPERYKAFKDFSDQGGKLWIF